MEEDSPARGTPSPPLSFPLRENSSFELAWEDLARKTHDLPLSCKKTSFFIVFGRILGVEVEEEKGKEDRSSTFIVSTFTWVEREEEGEEGEDGMSGEFDRVLEHGHSRSLSPGGAPPSPLALLSAGLHCWGS